MELATLLAPLTPQEFVRDYWARRPLFVKGFAGKYAGFFDAETFSRAVSPPGPFPDEFLRASFDRKTENGTSAPQPGERTSSVFRANPDQALPLYTAGATLCVSAIERRVPTLVPFLAAIKRQLGYPGKVGFNAYLSPPGSGFNWHFDARIASTLQVAGTKRWRYAEHVATAWPAGNGTLRADGTPVYSEPGIASLGGDALVRFDPDAVTEVLLEPGDLLILPAGTWHEACGGDGGSLALNLSFSPLSYTQIVRRLLDTLLGTDGDWRAAQPLLAGAFPGEADPAGIAAIGAQLARASAVLGSLSGDSAAVVRLWETLVMNPDPGAPPPRAQPVMTTAVEPGQRLRLRADGELFPLLADGGTRLCIAIGTGRTIELNGEAIPFAQRMLAQRRFVAGDCVTWSATGVPFAWNDVAAMLTRLKTEGLLEDDAPDS